MSIYDQDFNYIYQELLPPDKRLPVFSGYGAAKVKPLQWLHDLTFIDYADGTAGNEYDNAATYNKGNRVHYNQKVFEAQKTLTGVTPATTLVKQGDNDGNWMLVLTDFRGARERVTYNGQKLTLEWILNKWFGTNFIQPVFTASNTLGNNYPSGSMGITGHELRSDFYIDSLPTDQNSFLVVKTDTENADYVKRENDKNIDYGVGADYNPLAPNLRVSYPLTKIPTISDPGYAQMVALVYKYAIYALNRIPYPSTGYSIEFISY